MSKKPSKSTSLAPASKRRTPAARKPATLAVAPATADTLLPLLRSELAVAKLVGTGGGVAREDGVVLVTGRGYATSAGIVPAEEIYYDRESRPDGDGVWLGEADKVSWRDEASGYDCIMLRDSRRGFLSGYVGVPSDHPLWGWDSEAVAPDIGIEVHGGLTYSRLCQDGPTPARRLAVEARRICHVVIRPDVFHEVEHATDHRVEDKHAWWFGFECDHAFDLVPGDGRGSVAPSSSELARTYRDDAYVFRETTALAAQLRAVADGSEAPPRDGPPPPVGLDPTRGGCRG
ncbi:MAG: hypothetical protein E7773_11380 [Sphingomonas sp.]|uniref:hypothetical protein n=1 Tax=Sphingomonas sp. TaxID=28214 RepID=UPI00120AC3D6|nr:hypothetical protein [Sphingomonas sp.]THD35059.1 MAG: hypothetical protein E7773_11380 [Sphingomonas sp.]